MKGIRMILAVLAVAGITGFSGLATFAQGIGIVDLDRIVSDYNKAQDVSTDMKVKEAELQKFVADAQKQLKDTASPVERKNLEDKLTSDFKTKSDNFRDLQVKQWKQIEDSVFAAINQVSQSKSMDLILNKAGVIQGGTDITDQVLSVLNGGSAGSKK